MKKDLSPVPFPNGKGCLLAKVHALRELHSASEEESHRRRTLIPSILDEVFKGEL
jgi:hypothetical protein